jgi:hypothetical protein
MIRLRTNKDSLVFLAIFLLLLLGAREVFAAPLPELQTLAAQRLVAGTAEPGQELLVVRTLTLPEGERFAQVKVADRLLWIRIGEDEHPTPGETLQVKESGYLFLEPVVEEGAEAELKPERGRLFGGSSLHPLSPRQLGINQACVNFIGADGSFGPWGSYLMGRINPKEHPQLFSGTQSDLGKVCPNFSRMNEREKKNFWVWVIAAMANYESSCRERIQARGVNGIAAGLLQMHKGKEHVYGCRRGIDSLKARDNLECGLTILNNDLRRTGMLFPRNRNYWEVLRPHTRPGQRTLKLVREYRPCF